MKSVAPIAHDNEESRSGDLRPRADIPWRFPVIATSTTGGVLESNLGTAEAIIAWLEEQLALAENASTAD